MNPHYSTLFLVERSANLHGENSYLIYFNPAPAIYSISLRIFYVPLRYLSEFEDFNNNLYEKEKEKEKSQLQKPCHSEVKRSYHIS